MNIHLAVDSGAFSLYRKRVGAEKVSGSSISAKIAGQRRKNNDFYDTDELTQYLMDYAAYVKQYAPLLDFYVTVDAMFDAKRSWELLLRLEKLGLKPMPVFHCGGDEDFVWLKKYMDRYEYIGAGGIARSMGLARRMAFLRRMFAYMRGKDGHMKWKTHGFGVTSGEVMAAFPWYSCDSFSALTMALNGRMQLPMVVFKGKKIVGFRFDKLGSNISVSARRQHDQGSYSKLGPSARAAVDAYLESIGTSFEAVCNDDKERIFASYYFYAKMAIELSAVRPEHDPLRLYFAGTIDKWIYPLLPRLEKVGIKDFRVLGSFFTDRKFIDLFPNGKVPRVKVSSPALEAA
jgi:hypothetical protein